MKQLVLLCVLLLATRATTAQAGLHLAYNDCGSGVTNLDNACTSNTGRFDIVASFDAPAGTIAVVGEQGVLDIQVSGGTVPAWWQAVVPGSCRGAAVAVAYNAPAPSCADYFNTIAYPTGSYFRYDYYPVSGNTAPGRVRIRTTSQIDPSRATSFEAAGIAPGTETYVFTVWLKMNRTVGADACAGCGVPACWVFNSLMIYQPLNVPDFMLVSPGGSGAYVAWQGGVVGSGPFGSDCPGATPARTTSWGQVKSLYR